MTTRQADLCTLVFLSLAWIAGCTKDSGEKELTPPKARSGSETQPGATYLVSILGDATRVELLAKIATAHNGTVKTSGPRQVADVRQSAGLFRLQASSEESVATQAALAWESDLILLAVDATQGPLPIHREHVLISRQMAVPTVVIAFTKSDAIDDPELLELEELEMRELLNTYSLPGDTVPCVFDGQATKSSTASTVSKGPAKIVELLGATVRKRSARTSREGKQFKANVYALVPQEAFTQDVAIGIKSGPAAVLMGNESAEAEIVVTREIAPGTNGEIDIFFAKPIQVGQEQRFLLLNKQHVAGAGSFLVEIPDSR